MRYTNVGIHLSQTKYIIELLMKYGFSNIKPLKTPISKKSSIYTNPGNPLSDSREYRSVVDSL